MNKVAYRNNKIREAARGEQCTFLGPTCNNDIETVVFCHLNYSWAGKAAGRKADDYAGFFGCYQCHTLFDSNALDYNERLSLAFKAVLRTWSRLLNRGVLK